MYVLRKYCLEFIQEAQSERQIRVDRAKDEHFARIEEEKEVRLREEEEERLRMIEVSKVLTQALLGGRSCLISFHPTEGKTR